MKVYLAGYNVDTSVLDEIQEKSGRRSELTPEVLSAAYARISRDPRPINEIRKEAREEVSRSRKSNETIIFKMGHHSVAEHAVFNLDILGVSRLVMEEVEKFRLCAYTEKSQRYITLDKDFVVPEEIKGSPFEKMFVDMIHQQNEVYFQLFDRLKTHVFKKFSDLAEDPKKHNLLEGWAKEDARYVTALATESQVGQTINARNLELLLRRFASHPLAEVRNLGRAIYDQIGEVAPSIVIFHEANDRDLKTYPELKNTTQEVLKAYPPAPAKEGEAVQLVEVENEGDDGVAAALIHSSSNLSYTECKTISRKMTTPEKEKIFKAALQNMQFYDSMLREFEFAHLTFNIILSAACFGQLKRHRMASIISQAYDPALGITVPESIQEIGMDNQFKAIIQQTEEVYRAISKEIPLAAPYILTNAHRKRVLIRVNARELYHISRLREDTHAQWDIRKTSEAMTEKAKKVMPLTFMMTGGKDRYSEIYEKVFGSPPKIVQAALPGVRKIK